MNLQSPSTIAAAWLLLPLFVIAVSWSLGMALRVVSGLELGVMTVPAGFMVGMSVMTGLLVVGVSGKVTVAVVLVLAVASLAWLAVRRDGLRRARAWRPRRTLVWGAAAGVVAYAIAMAPVAGSGRLGILGYVFNNDPSIHVSLVQTLYDGHVHSFASMVNSYVRTSTLFETGYPLGSYTWLLVARTVSGVDPFHLWAPFGALGLGLLALPLFDLLRSLRAPAPFAAAGATLAATGHLLFAYQAQGGNKEVLMPAMVYGAIALAARALRRPLTFRSLLPAAFGAVAAVADLGYAALAWIGPAALVALGVLFWRAYHGRTAGELRSAVAFVGVGALVAVPAVVTSVHFYNSQQGDLFDPKEVGNLLGPVSVFQALNIWPAQDYRFPDPDHVALSHTGMAIAGALAIAGLAFALARRNLGIAMAAVAGVAGVALITPRTSIYYDAKTYVVLAPAVGLATFAGVFALSRVRRIGLPLAALAGAVVAFGILASNATTYGGVWLTPKQRFEQLGTIANRFAGRGPMLISDREQYGVYFMRRSRPWDDWGYRQLVDYPHVRFAERLPPQPPRNPDLDDYLFNHVEYYKLLLERKSPDASLPPSNYRLVDETSFYRVWERDGPRPLDHVPYGIDGQQGVGPFGCAKDAQPSRPRVRALVRRAEQLHRNLAVSVGGVEPHILVTGFNWIRMKRSRVVPPPDESAGYGGIGSTVVRVPAGRYDAWLQGSYGSGVRVTMTSQAGSRVLGEVRNDLGLPDGWFPLGQVDLAGRTNTTIIGLTPNKLIAGNRHFNLNGKFAIVPAGARGRIVRLDPRRIGTLCGKKIDWIELPAA
ncbi:MAG: hypothetical protein ACJ77M_14885 [Thermoleophilaceae bacterium]